RREGRRLQQIAVLRVLVDDDVDTELQLFVRLDDLATVEAGRLVHLEQGRSAPLVAPELEDEGADPLGAVGELEFGHVLRHGRGDYVYCCEGSQASKTTLSLSSVTHTRRVSASGNAAVSSSSADARSPRKLPAGTRRPSSPVSQSQYQSPSCRP